jgi:hypothetical protein
MELKFRTPHRCQNDHFRWLYWEPKDGFVNSAKWGDKHPDCNCPTGDIDQGFRKVGDHQLWTGLYDMHNKPIYRRDIIKHAHNWDYEQSRDQDGKLVLGARKFKKPTKKDLGYRIGMIHWSGNGEHAEFVIWPYRLCLHATDLIEIIGTADENPEHYENIIAERKALLAKHGQTENDQEIYG